MPRFKLKSSKICKTEGCDNVFIGDTRKKYCSKKCRNRSSVMRSGLKSNKRRRDVRKSHKDGYTRVYLLPNENYAGISDNLKYRLCRHKSQGKDVSKVRIVFRSKNRILAHLVETILHLFGWNGYQGN